MNHCFFQYEEGERQKPPPANRALVAACGGAEGFNIANSNSDYSADTDSDSDSDTDALPRLRRRNSETFRAQYINKKEIKICAATWNIGGRVPPEDLDLDGWLDVDDPADIYVIGLQEIIPLNAGNIFGAEDSRQFQFKPSEDAPVIEDEILLESDSDIEEEIHPLNEELNGFGEIKDVQVKGENFLSADTSVSNDYDNSRPLEQDLQRQFSSPKKLARLNCLRTDDSEENVEAPNSQHMNKLTKTLSGTERIGLSWPELPLHLLPQPITERPNSFKSLRRHIQNLNVSTVGVGVMGYIGNKVCYLLLSFSSHFGEKEADAIKRNADVHEIHRRTRFSSLAGMGLRKSIYDHERIIWLGDLNYRINLPYERTRELISKKEWSMLAERDQLIKELRKGRAFDGWSEGTLSFAPTYKYELNSKSYVGEDPRAGRRTPAWCDRVLSYGTGMRLLSYRRSELTLSDHRPVTASYMVEVEVFSPRRLQRALTFTDAEIEEQDIVTEMGLGGGIGRLRSGEDASYWER
ncbi:Type IV inositol polyphosphate 5-phosphatase 3 [Sesamum angolense]|uniref:Type IV inositol polyphosphate 5-phosphatase 3 n=1 Tax=Sesamum angolense TaxID=2727404 RepID=A0AAE1T4F6_9LAMI|nr:Type IV inositol polyphosphate 5-phosphatase 3 [Sesamum angolense]